MPRLGIELALFLDKYPVHGSFCTARGGKEHARWMPGQGKGNGAFRRGQAGAAIFYVITEYRGGETVAEWGRLRTAHPPEGATDAAATFPPRPWFSCCPGLIAGGGADRSGGIPAGG